MVVFQPSNIVSLETKNSGKHPGNHFYSVFGSLRIVQSRKAAKNNNNVNVVDIATGSG